MSRVPYFLISCMFLNIILALTADAVNADSLWQRKMSVNHNLFDDNRGKRVGDIVTVLVVEETAIDNDEGASTENTNTQSGSMNNNGFLGGLVSALTNDRNKKFTTRTANGYSGSFVQNFAGKGTYDSTRKINLRLTAMIVEVLDNGNLLLEGRRTIDVNKERYMLELTGIARPIDITTANTIISSQLSNVNFALKGKGWLTRSGKKGWIYRVRDIIWPF